MYSRSRTHPTPATFYPGMAKQDNVAILHNVFVMTRLLVTLKSALTEVFFLFARFLHDVFVIYHKSSPPNAETG